MLPCAASTVFEQWLQLMLSPCPSYIAVSYTAAVLLERGCRLCLQLSALPLRILHDGPWQPLFGTHLASNLATQCL